MEETTIDLYDEIRKFTNLATRYVRNTNTTDAKSKLTHSQSIILVFIYDNQKEGRKVYQKDIENNFMIRRSTATEILKKLENLGYIKRKTSTLDARLKDLILTEKALSLVSCADQNIRSVGQIVGQNITYEEQLVLKNIILKMKSNLLNALKNEKDS